MAVADQGLIRDIEILRAVAVLGVICQHLDWNLIPGLSVIEPLGILLRGGWVGVDLFFAISGYVIARSYLPQALGPAAARPYRTIAYRFWIRRFFRLAPSAWLWLLVILVLCIAYNRTGVFGSLETNAWWTLAGVLNFSNYLFTQYYGQARPGASFVYWSLSLEEQFYLLFPLVVWLFRQRLAWFFLLLALVQLFAERGLYATMFRTDAIALGVLLAILQGGYGLPGPSGPFGRWPGRLVIWLLLGALFFAASLPREQLPRQLGIVAVLSAALVWFCSGDRDMLAGRGIVTRVMLWAGQRSYAMYLVHIPAMYFLRETAKRLDLVLSHCVPLSCALALALIAVLAEANYRWVEKPLRRRGRLLAARVGAQQPPHTLRE